jgi:hypothetical protein
MSCGGDVAVNCRKIGALSSGTFVICEEARHRGKFGVSFSAAIRQSFYVVGKIQRIFQVFAVVKRQSPCVIVSGVMHRNLDGIFWEEKRLNRDDLVSEVKDPSLSWIFGVATHLNLFVYLSVICCVWKFHSFLFWAVTHRNSFDFSSPAIHLAIPVDEVAIRLLTHFAFAVSSAFCPISTPVRASSTFPTRCTPASSEHPAPARQ